MKKSRSSKSVSSTAVTTASAAALPAAQLASFPNPAPQRDYVVRIVVPEFTCLCPLTAQPDFARFELDFIPDQRNVELKSLKLYFAAYRNLGAFHEAVTNRVLDDLVALIAPRFLRITARWNVRGGVYTTVIVEHRKRGWKPLPLVELGGASGGETAPVPFEAPRS
jgi:7-cyano-7-deazaguanine reductase